ncbi:MAG: AAA family ATPase [Paracoccaceae bacterium]
MTNKTIYMTGAPAAGKSTLATSLVRAFENVEVFEYGSRMSRWLSTKADTENDVKQEELRSGTDHFVTRTDICRINAEMDAWIHERSSYSHLIIDSHQVTIEEFGLIYEPFAKEELSALRIDEIWVIDVDPSIAIDRIARDPKGRTLPNEHTALMHSISQMSVATAYGAMKCVPVVVMDGGQDQDCIVRSACHRLGLI